MREIRLWEEVQLWMADLEDKKLLAVKAALSMLEEQGPALRRPLTDLVKGGEFSNLKELRPPGTTIRMLYIFDPDQVAVVLVAGDKRGQWNDWYKGAMKTAEKRYRQWLDEK